MKYINEYNKDDFKEDVITTYYNKLGQVTEEENDSFAKTICTNENETYYVQTLRNIIYDPYGIDSHREKYLELQYKQVNKEVFDLYLLYLTGRNGVYLAKSQRRFING